MFFSINYLDLGGRELNSFFFGDNEFREIIWLTQLNHKLGFFEVCDVFILICSLYE
jgi:hypothetical protein